MKKWPSAPQPRRSSRAHTSVGMSQRLDCSVLRSIPITPSTVGSSEESSVGSGIALEMATPSTPSSSTRFRPQIFAYLNP